MNCGMCQNLSFVMERDGGAAAADFARQAVRAYRRATLELRGRIMRRGMVAAYLCAKRWA